MSIKPTPTPTHKLGQAMQHVAESGKRPCFRIEGLRITIASEVSYNPGYLYIKDDNWNYIGKISPYGLIKIMHPSKITSEQKTLVLAAINDPEGTAISNGKATGTCCCCGRTLTNKLSIELGIGPICRGFWFPPQDSLDLGIDTELDLGALSKEPVIDLFNNYLALNSTQQGILANMIKTDYWSKNPNACN